MTALDWAEEAEEDALLLDPLEDPAEQQAQEQLTAARTAIVQMLRAALVLARSAELGQEEKEKEKEIPEAAGTELDDGKNEAEIKNEEEDEAEVDDDEDVDGRSSTTTNSIPSAFVDVASPLATTTASTDTGNVPSAVSSSFADVNPIDIDEVRIQRVKRIAFVLIVLCIVTKKTFRKPGSIFFSFRLNS
jgi:hypothetical protein